MSTHWAVIAAQAVSAATLGVPPVTLSQAQATAAVTTSLAATPPLPVAKPVPKKATAPPTTEPASTRADAAKTGSTVLIEPPLLADGTPIRLMILREVNTHTAQIGDRLKLRVDEPVFLNGKIIVPVGATAWGEVSLVEGNGAVGKGGKLSARLLYLDLPTGHVPLRGSYSRQGAGNGAGVMLAVVGFGLPGLLMGGDSGRLKAGDTFTGFVVGPQAAPAEQR